MFPVTQAKYSSTSGVIHALYSLQGGVAVATNNTQPLQFIFTQLKLSYLKTNINFLLRICTHRQEERLGELRK